MAHFAKISEENIVLTVNVVDNNNILNSEGIEDETVGQQFLETNSNWPSHLWIQTSYNTINNTHRHGGTPFRGNYASIGMTYDKNNDIFIGTKPYASWVLDVLSASWKSPIGNEPALTAEQESQNISETHFWKYVWNESTIAWDLIDQVI